MMYSKSLALVYEVQGEREKRSRRKKEGGGETGRGRGEVEGQLNKRLFGRASPGQGFEGRK